MNHAAACNLVRLAVSEMGGICLPYTTGGFRDETGRLVKVGLPGASDLVACINGRFYGIEVKVGRDRQRLAQKKFQAAVERAGGKYVLARFPSPGVEALKEAVDAG